MSIELNNACKHTTTQGRASERGSWCTVCGEKVYDVEHRKCKDCTHSRAVFGGMICHKHLMRIIPDMHVTFNIADGSCWEAKAQSQNQ